MLSPIDATPFVVTYEVGFVSKKKIAIDLTSLSDLQNGMVDYKALKLASIPHFESLCLQAKEGDLSLKSITSLQKVLTTISAHDTTQKKNSHLSEIFAMAWTVLRSHFRKVEKEQLANDALEREKKAEEAGELKKGETQLLPRKEYTKQCLIFFDEEILKIKEQRLGKKITLRTELHYLEHLQAIVSNYDDESTHCKNATRMVKLYCETIETYTEELIEALLKGQKGQHYMIRGFLSRESLFEIIIYDSTKPFSDRFTRKTISHAGNGKWHHCYSGGHPQSDCLYAIEELTDGAHPLEFRSSSEVNLFTLTFIEKHKVTLYCDITY